MNVWVRLVLPAVSSRLDLSPRRHAAFLRPFACPLDVLYACPESYVVTHFFLSLRRGSISLPPSLSLTVPQVLRVRSLIEIANGMCDDVCIHVGLLREGVVPSGGSSSGGSGGRRRRRSSSTTGPQRFEWEALVLPGKKQP